MPGEQEERQGDHAEVDPPGKGFGAELARMGHLALGREDDVRCPVCRAKGNDDLVELVKRLERERDEALSRVQELEGERDEYRDLYLGAELKCEAAESHLARLEEAIGNVLNRWSNGGSTIESIRELRKAPSSTRPNSSPDSALTHSAPPSPESDM